MSGLRSNFVLWFWRSEKNGWTSFADGVGLMVEDAYSKYCKVNGITDATLHASTGPCAPRSANASSSSSSSSSNAFASRAQTRAAPTVIATMVPYGPTHEKIQVEIAPFKYELDFAAMTQTNLLSLRVREIHREVHQDPIWVWYLTSKIFRKYPPEAQEVFEEELDYRENSGLAVWNEFHIDVNKLEQTNIATNVKRRVERVRSGVGGIPCGPYSPSAVSKIVVDDRRSRAISWRTYHCDGAGGASPSCQSLVQSVDRLPDDIIGEVCCICLDPMENASEESKGSPICRLKRCSHYFHYKCIDRYVKKGSKSKAIACPLCNRPQAVSGGPSPPGEMTVTLYRAETRPGVEGYPNDGLIRIEYKIPAGTQSDCHSRPGATFTGTQRLAFLPNNPEGKNVLELLILAFEKGYTFTVGQSQTSGTPDTVIWNGIPHKTSTRGGEGCHGFPDPGYLKRVTDVLAQKGIVKGS